MALVEGPGAGVPLESEQAEPFRLRSFTLASSSEPMLRLKCPGNR